MICSPRTTPLGLFSHGFKLEAELLRAAAAGVDAPEIDREMSRHRHDRLLAHGASGARAFAQEAEPFRARWILRLEAHHAPGALDQGGAHARVAAFGHAPG